MFQDKKLEQTFVANYPGLSQIDVLFKGDSATAGQRVNFHLKETCASKNDVFYSFTELPRTDNLAFHPFTFSPIDGSTGQTYCIVLEAPEAMPESAVKLQLSTGDLYPFGTLKSYNSKNHLTDSNNASLAPEIDNSNTLQHKIYLPVILRQPEPDEVIHPADIGFRLHYKGLPLPTARVFVTRLTANKPSVWGQPWFYGGLVAVYVVLLAGLFYLAQKTIRFDAEE